MLILNIHEHKLNLIIINPIFIFTMSTDTHHHDEINSGKFFLVRSRRFLPLKDKASVFSVGECAILKM